MSAPEVGSPEWSRIVTASKMAAIIGVSPWESPYSCWHQMKGLASREQNQAMRRGIYLEPAILAWWRDQHPEQMAFYREQEWFPHESWAGATVDAYFGEKPTGRGAIVEAKSAARMDEWGRPGTDEIPAYYLTQVYFQLAVSGAARCYVPVIGPFLDFSEYVVEADPAIQADLLERARVFYDSLAGDVPPELDSSVATYDVVRKLHPDIEAGAVVEFTLDEAGEFIIALNEKRASEARERAAKSLFLERMGRAQYAECNGVRVARRQPNQYGIQLNQVAKSPTALITQESA